MFKKFFVFVGSLVGRFCSLARERMRGFRTFVEKFFFSAAYLRIVRVPSTEKSKVESVKQNSFECGLREGVTEVADQDAVIVASDEFNSGYLKKSCLSFLAKGNFISGETVEGVIIRHDKNNRPIVVGHINLTPDEPLCERVVSNFRVRFYSVGTICNGRIKLLVSESQMIFTHVVLVDTVSSGSAHFILDRNAGTLNIGQAHETVKGGVVIPVIGSGLYFSVHFLERDEPDHNYVMVNHGVAELVKNIRGLVVGVVCMYVNPDMSETNLVYRGPGKCIGTGLIGELTYNRRDDGKVEVVAKSDEILYQHTILL